MNIDLKDWILKQLQKCPIAKNPAELTVGIEHEFFLWDPARDLPCTQSQSQEFLRSLAQEPQWYVREQTPENGITRVSHEFPQGRYCAIKYDHAPHLMEIAFPYTDNLGVLHQEVVRVLEHIAKTALEMSLRALHQPLIPVAPMHPSVMSPIQTFVNLRHYRAELLKRSGHGDDPAQNYAAVIAATQTHIGGFDWWNREDGAQAIETLYGFELPILQQAGFTPRWMGYHKVFSDFPLVGFPKLTEWNIDTWIDALLHSPLAGDSRSPWTGKTTEDLGGSPFGGDWKSWFGAVRDLQIIRPKLFGTLEFRADSAQPSAELITAHSALRLGLVAAVMYGHRDTTPVSFGKKSQQWWTKALTDETSPTEEFVAVYQTALNGLQLRRKSEEKYLFVLNPQAMRRAHA